MRFSSPCYHQFRNTVRSFLARPLIILLVLLLAFFPCHAQSPSPESVSLDDALRALAERIASVPNLRGPYRVQFFQEPNFAAETGKEWQDFIRKELESRHVVTTEGPGAAQLRIGVTQTPTELVLSAAVRVGEKDDVRLLKFPRAVFRVASLPVAPVRLEKQFVYQSGDRLLDVSSLWNGASAGMALLTYRGSELLMLRLDATGVVQQTVSLSAAGPLLTRDPHAELLVQADAVSVLLPNKACQFTWAAPADAKCHGAKTLWRAATVLTPSCDAGGWKLQADGVDWTVPDLLQAVPDNSVQKGSASLVTDFPGPIISINGVENPSSALVVTRNLRTGNYEVYKITLACGN
jgi:hypothetical protein